MYIIHTVISEQMYVILILICISLKTSESELYFLSSFLVAIFIVSHYAMKWKMSEAKTQRLIPPQGSFTPPVPSGYYKLSVTPTG